MAPENFTSEASGYRPQSGKRIALFLARSRGFRCVILAHAHKVFELAHEFVDILEGSIDRGETHIGNLIDAVKLVHHRAADKFARHFLAAEFRGSGLDAVRDLFNCFHRDRPLFAGALDTRDDLEAIIRLAAAVLLDHHRSGFFDALVSGEAPFAGSAHAPAPDGRAITRHAGVNDAVAAMAAEGTTHS